MQALARCFDHGHLRLTESGLRVTCGPWRHLVSLLSVVVCSPCVRQESLALVGRPQWTPLRPGDTPVVSYSQNAEDVRLWRVFERVENGFYVDVGAADPSEGSVTRLFYDRGWSGINVEPSPAYDALSAARGRDVNLRVAVGESEGSSPFFLTYPDLGMSTVDPAIHAHVADQIERVEEITVPQRRLESILREHAAGRTIHFLKLDVEGAEREVLASSDWNVFRPIVVVVEAIAAWSTTPTHEAWEPLLLGAGYDFATFDGINRFYVDHNHADLITAVAYPVSALDRFVSASVRMKEIEADERVQRAKAERASIAARLDQVLGDVNRVSGELSNERKESESLRLSLERTRADHEAARKELQAVYQSPTWRAGRLVAVAGKPALKATRQLRRLSLSSRRKPKSARVLAPAQAYAASVKNGQPWHFPRRPVTARMRSASSLKTLLDRLGEPHSAVGVVHASELDTQLDLIGWSDEESLVAKRLSWEERQAVVEADAIVRLVIGRPDDIPTMAQHGRRTFGRPTVVVDARCLQDPMYSTRGVGLHGRRVLQATRTVAAGHSLVLLTSADLPTLEEDVAEVADYVAVAPYALRATDVALFLELSPMTASCAATVPFLGRPKCATASVVHDFIPTEFSAAYLRSVTSALTNRTRIEALRNYDLLLTNSDSTEAACQRILGESATTVVTGVGDPLHEVSSRSPDVDGPYMLVSAGGDARKNVAAAVTALARHRQTGGGPLRAVVTGALTVSQSAALNNLASQVGLPSNALELRGYVADDELAGLYEGADLAFVASLTEGFSIPVAESIARGTPVVASDIPVHRELVGVGPWLAAPTDIEALAKALGYVRGNTEVVVAQQRNVLGEKADPDRVVDRIVTALEALLSDRRDGRRGQRSQNSRPRLAVVSPFPPQRSGVADYTAFTFRQVAHYADVEVYTPASPDISGPFRMHRLSSAPYLDRRFDAVVNVIGNSHFHFPILDLLGSYGGAAISHDNRMMEAYRYDRGEAWTADLLSRSGTHVLPEEIEEFVLDLDRLPSVGYDLIARQASPLIVHGAALADRIHRETGVSPVVVPFVPYNVPDSADVDDAARARSRAKLGFVDDVAHLATFGIVDSRTKRTDLVMGALAWLRDWGRPAHLHIVGDTPKAEQDLLEALAAELRIAAHVTLHGHVTAEEFKDYLLAVDAAAQLRTSALLSLSGALADCVAYGVPTVTTRDIAGEMDAPPYVVTTGTATSSLLIAEALDELCGRRREHASTIETERREYLERRNVDAYARALLVGLGLWSA